ncbi:MAG: hypothetical protein WBB19_17525 [Desulforhopalus sp.]
MARNVIKICGKHNRQMIYYLIFPILGAGAADREGGLKSITVHHIQAIKTPFISVYQRRTSSLTKKIYLTEQAIESKPDRNTNNNP